MMKVFEKFEVVEVVEDVEDVEDVEEFDCYKDVDNYDKKGCARLIRVKYFTGLAEILAKDGDLTIIKNKGFRIKQTEDSLTVKKPFFRYKLYNNGSSFLFSVISIGDMVTERSLSSEELQGFEKQ